VNAPIIYVDGEKDAYACSPEFHGRVLLIPRGSWVSCSWCVNDTRGVRRNPFTTFHLYPQPHIVLRIVTHQWNHYLIFTGYPLVDALASAFVPDIHGTDCGDGCVLRSEGRAPVALKDMLLYGCSLYPSHQVLGPGQSCTTFRRQRSRS
jgi:hypothetical protein